MEVYFKHIAPIQMFFTRELKSGICFTDDENQVRRNCQRLRIKLDEIDNMPSAIDIYRYNHFVFCIYKLSAKLSLYVFSTSASKRSVEEVVKTFQENAAQTIIETGEFPDYNFTISHEDLETNS